MKTWPTPPYTDAQLSAMRFAATETLLMQGIRYSKITCDTCGFRAQCEYAYDFYNTDGDCLEQK